MWDVIVLVPNHCLSIYFSYDVCGGTWDLNVFSSENFPTFMFMAIYRMSNDILKIKMLFLPYHSSLMRKRSPGS